MTFLGQATLRGYKRCRYSIVAGKYNAYTPSSRKYHRAPRRALHYGRHTIGSGSAYFVDAMVQLRFGCF